METYLGLRNSEVSPHERSRAQGSPNKENVGAEVALVRVDHVRGDDGDDGVPQPVGGGGQSDTAGADGQGEDLANDDPRTGTPGDGEDADVDGDEGDLGVDGGDVVGAGDGGRAGGDDVGVVETDGVTDDGDDVLADEQAQGTPDEQLAAADPLDEEEGDGGRDDVDDVEDGADEEGVGDGAGRLKEGGGVVEDEVDARPLLHHLQRRAENGLAQVGVGLEDRAAEAVGPAVEPAAGRDESALVLLVGDDLCKLGLDELGVRGLASQAREGGTGLLDLAALDEETGRVGEEDQTDTEDDTEDKLDADRDAVRGRAGVALGAVVDAGRQEQTNGDAELVAGNERATNLARANLGHVQDDNGGLETDTDTSDQTTGNNDTEAVDVDLDNDTDDVDDAAGNDGQPAADDIGNVTGSESAEEGTAGEDGDDERLVGAGQFAAVVGVNEVDEGDDGGDAVDVSGVVAKEHATEGREGADEVGLPGDGGLDAVDIGRGRELGARHAGRVFGSVLLLMLKDVGFRIQSWGARGI